MRIIYFLPIYIFTLFIILFTFINCTKHNRTGKRKLIVMRNNNTLSSKKQINGERKRKLNLSNPHHYEASYSFESFPNLQKKKANLFLEVFVLLGYRALQ